MRLTVDMRLTRNSHLINGEKIVGGAFAASVKLLVQHGRASSKYFWRASFVAVTFTNRSGGCLSERYYPWNGRRATTMTNSLSVISSMLLSLAMFLRVFAVF